MDKKSGNKINIDPANKGKFGKYCKSKGHKGVTKKCIEQGKKSRSKKVRKRAVFADNARKWNKGKK